MGFIFGAWNASYNSSQVKIAAATKLIENLKLFEQRGEVTTFNTDELEALSEGRLGKIIVNHRAFFTEDNMAKTGIKVDAKTGHIIESLECSQEDANRP